MADVTDSESAGNPHSNADVTDVTDRNGQHGGEDLDEPLVAALQARLGGDS